MMEPASDPTAEISWQSSVLRSPPADGSWLRDIIFITLLSGAIFLLCFSHRDLANPDEGRYAEIPREMVTSGDWVTPRLDGVKYFEKPPLVYWMEATCMLAFGPAEWSLRLPAALFSIGGLLLTYAVARRLFGRSAGLAAAMILATSGLYFLLSGLLILDVAVSVLITATLVCFILGVRAPAGATRRWLFYALYASAALATLTKGLIGFLLPGAVMFFWLLLFNQWRRLRPLYLPTGSLLFLVIAAPWHLLAAARNPDWAHFYFVQEHWERFTTKAHDRYEPWWYFVPVLVLGLMPWTGFLWPALRSLIAGGRTRWRENADAWFFVVWAAFVFLFFSASDSKLIPYVLPVFPPLAVLIGRWHASDDAKKNRGWHAGLGVFVVGALVFAAVLIYVVPKPGVIRDEAQRAIARPYASVTALILACGVVAVAAFARGRRWKQATIAVFAATLASLVTLAVSAPNFITSGTKKLALVVREQARPEEPVFHYRDFFHDFTYYAQRFAGTVDYVGELELAIDDAARTSGRFIDDAEFRRQWAGPGRMWLVVRKRNATELLSDPGFQHYLIGETNGRLLLSNQPASP